MLNKQLYQLGIVIDYTCKGCEEEDKRTEHLLYHCSVLGELRGALLGDNWLNMAMVVDEPVKSLIQFILKTSWLADTKNEGSIMGLFKEKCRHTPTTFSFNSNPDAII